MEKKIFIKDLKENNRFADIFMVKAAKLGETRAGKPYLVLTVMDRSGEVSGPIWDNAERLQKICKVGELLHLAGQVQVYRESLQLRIDDIQPVDKKSMDLGDFFPATEKCRRQMADELQKLIKTISNPYIKKLLNYFFYSSSWWQKFQQAPAAKGVHHAYIGGLLEHSLSVATTADFLADHYDGVDRSMLIAGALLHDIGKLEELNMESGVIDYTVRGRLKGHLVIGSEMVDRAAGKIHDFPSDLLERLQHLILSHHGRQEFGSPTVPMTVEAFMLSLLDDLDAKLNIIEQLRKKMDSEEMGWTDYQRILERYLYLGGFAVQEKEKIQVEKNSTGRQPSLF